MSTTLRNFFALLSVIVVVGVVGLLFGQNNGASTAQFKVYSQSGIKWNPGPDALPKGAQMVLFDGDPSKEGPFTMRIKLPDNYQIPAHWHATDERVTVLSGALNVGHGDKFNASAGKVVSAGDFVLIPANEHHFAWTKGETIIQFNNMGPWEINYINPQEDPRNK